MIRKTAMMLTTTAAVFAGSTAVYAAQMDIVETASSTGTFNTLLAAASAAGLVDTLKSEGPYTVFAPTDAAFAALPEGTVEMLLMPENKDKLVSILTHHVVSGALTTTSLEDNQLIQSMNGSFYVIDLDDEPSLENVTVSTSGVYTVINEDNDLESGDATITMADVAASNGVIHVIDTVIMPE